MRVFPSKVDEMSGEFVENRNAMTRLCGDLHAALSSWQGEGNAKRVRAHRRAGKLLGRERLNLLLDVDAPFLEIGALYGYNVPGVPGNSLVTGVGVVQGVECMCVVYVPTVGHGAMNTIVQAKWQRAMEIAKRQRLPFLQLLETAGADLEQAFDVFHTRPNPFYELARKSETLVPSVTVVFGTCIAGGAYMGGMSDYTVMVRGKSHLALAGTKLVAVATGEVATEEELGGAALHATVTGSADYIVDSERAAVKKVRELVSTFSITKRQATATAALLPPCEPVYSAASMLGVIAPPAADGTPPKHSYDIREVAARLVDGSAMHEFKPAYGTTIACVWAQIAGVPVGIIGNNGVILAESAQKAAHFINLCNQRGVPIIYLHNVTGFMVGTAYERQAMIKCGSQMVAAQSQSRVPQISIVVGGSFGAANYAMSGVGFEPDFIFSFPSSQCAVMGPQQLSGVLGLLARERMLKAGRAVDEAKIQKITSGLAKTTTTQMNVFYSSARGIDDGIIDPRDARPVLAACLSILLNNEFPRSALQASRL
jgi:acetyl-CoA carboxylase carboxyltransferase component